MGMMKFGLRGVGTALLLVATMFLGMDLAAIGEAGGFQMTPLGQYLYEMDPAMLNTTQAFVQRYLAPWIWEYGFQSVLQSGAALVSGIPGVACFAGSMMMGRKKQGRSLGQRLA